MPDFFLMKHAVVKEEQGIQILWITHWPIVDMKATLWLL